MEHYETACMNQDSAAELLGLFGLTRGEAQIYLQLLAAGDANGYEIAKELSLSRSNAYTALAALADKGAAWIVEGNPVRYTAVPAAEFTGNRLRAYETARERLLASLPAVRKAGGGYVTIRGASHIRDRLVNLVRETSERLYLSAASSLVMQLSDELKELLSSGKKLVVVTSAEALAANNLSDLFPGAELHGTNAEPPVLRAISDSRHAMTGDLPLSGAGPDASCLFSDERNLVELFKSALRNEILLADLSAADNSAADLSGQGGRS